MREEKEAIIKEVLRLLGEKYPVGLYEYLFKHRPELYKKLQHLEDRIDQAFLSATIQGLKAILRDYWTLHIMAIKEFKEIDQLDFNLPVARKELQENRIRA